MALAWGKSNGEAKKSDVTYMKLADGDNKFRIVSGVLPMYTYWVKGPTGKDVPFECLQFERDQERFVNTNRDPVKERLGKDVRCQWSYKCQVINRATGKVEVLQLKKSIMEGIMSVVEQVGCNPADFDEGIEFVVARKKTGPKAFNVEYTVKQLMCKQSPLSDEDRALIKDIKDLDELFPRQTPDAQAEGLDKFLSGGDEDESGSGSNSGGDVDEEAMNELED